MKTVMLLFVVLSSTFVSNAQTTVQDVAGIYERKLLKTGPYIINYTLDLNADGTFQFHSYSKIELGGPDKSRTSERNQYAKGTWAMDKKVVTFSTSSTDFDAHFTLDFNNSKARFISKSPRDKSDRVIETALRFYESGVDWIQSVIIFKIE